MKETSTSLKEENIFLNIFKGSFISLICTIVFLFIFSILLTYSSIPESSIPTIVIILTGISILIGSSITNIKLKKNGIINGGIIGLIYIIFLYFISSIVIGNFSFNLQSIIMILFGIISGVIGGIIGVNKN